MQKFYSILGKGILSFFLASFSGNAVAATLELNNGQTISNCEILEMNDVTYKIRLGNGEEKTYYKSFVKKISVDKMGADSLVNIAIQEKNESQQKTKKTVSKSANNQQYGGKYSRPNVAGIGPFVGFGGASVNNTQYKESSEGSCTSYNIGISSFYTLYGDKWYVEGEFFYTNRGFNISGNNGEYVYDLDVIKNYIFIGPRLGYRIHLGNSFTITPFFGAFWGIGLGDATNLDKVKTLYPGKGEDLNNSISSGSLGANFEIKRRFRIGLDYQFSSDDLSKYVSSSSTFTINFAYLFTGEF